MSQTRPWTSIGLAVVAGAFGAASLAGSTAAYAEEQEAGVIEEVIVTGSRIQRANITASSPVTQLDSEELEFTGITRVEDVLRYLPQVYAEQSTGQSNGGTGTATVALRDLGPERTLVLVNGRRLPPGSPLQGGETSDINQIPGALIERVEVLTGGASSVYGSDAVAGVANFILRDDFEGVQFDYQFSQYQHDNDDGSIQDLIAEAGYPVPDDTEWDGDINNFSLIIGGNLEGGRGNVTGYFTYRDVEALTQAARDYSGCALDTNAAACAGSATSPSGTFSDFGALPASDAGPSYEFRVEGNQFVEGAELFNFGPLNYWQRPDERYTAGAFARYDLTDTTSVFTEFMFMDDRTVTQIAPSGNFFQTSTINCDNPLLSAQQQQSVCGDYGLGPDDDQVMFIGRRNVEGGPRQQDLRHTTFRGVLGVEGEIDDVWRFEVTGQYAEVSMENTYLNDLSNTRLARALNVVTDERVDDDGDPVNPETFGQPVCQSVVDGSDPDCVPWNIFQEGGVTQEAVDYMVLPLFARGTTDQTVFIGYVEGNLGEYGWKLPSADSGVSVILGAEYRDVNLDFNPDRGFQTGEGAGQGGATLPVEDAGYDVTEGFAEVSLPVVEGAPFVDALVFDLGYRYSDYSTGVDADTYKVAASWDIDPQVRIRASYNRAIRAAQLRELFLPQGFNLFDMDVDPCGGANPERTLEECARTGVTPGQYGNIANSPANQYNFLQGGNPDLDPEESDTYSVGVVLAPNAIEGLTVSLDYYEIEVEDAISNLNPEFILDQCLDTGESQFCGAIRRGAGGDLWIGSDVDTSGRVAALNENLALFEVKGIDLVVDYMLELGDMGSLGFRNVLGYIDTWDQQEVEGAPTVSCEGVWGGVCLAPTLEYKNNFRTTWSTPWNAMISLNWRYLSSVDDINEQVDLGERNYFDLSGIWEVADFATVRAGINNLLDRDPPIAGGNAGPSNFGNGNTFPSTYDVLGRYYFLGATFTMGEG